MTGEILMTSKSLPSEQMMDCFARGGQTPRCDALRPVSSARTLTTDESAISTRSESEEGQGKKERWVARNDTFAAVMNKAKKMAEEQHLKQERKGVKKQGRKPSRAVTLRQKNSKKCAEICRLKKRIYTQLLEEKLANLDSEIERVRRAYDVGSNQLFDLRHRIDELSKNQQTRMLETDHIDTSSDASLCPVSWISDVSSDAAVYDKGDVNPQTWTETQLLEREKPVTDEPVTDGLGTDELATDEHATNELVADELVTGESETKQLAAGKPATVKSAIEEQITKEPMTKEPMTEQVLITEPVAGEPIAIDNDLAILLPDNYDRLTSWHHGDQVLCPDVHQAILSDTEELNWSDPVKSDEINSQVQESLIAPMLQHTPCEQIYSFTDFDEFNSCSEQWLSPNLSSLEALPYDSHVFT